MDDQILLSLQNKLDHQGSKQIQHNLFTKVYKSDSRSINNMYVVCETLERASTLFTCFPFYMAITSIEFFQHEMLDSDVIPNNAYQRHNLQLTQLRIRFCNVDFSYLTLHKHSQATDNKHLLLGQLPVQPPNPIVLVHVNKSPYSSNRLKQQGGVIQPS